MTLLSRPIDRVQKAFYLDDNPAEDRDRLGERAR
jgi:hypothetical protein